MNSAVPAFQPEIDPLDKAKFRDPDVTAKGEQRASVALRALETLWINTGTLCNLACERCYIESSPTNDRLVYITAEEVAAYFDEIRDLKLGTREIGFTGGEPFMNPDFMEMLGGALDRGFEALVLTNAMRPMMKCRDAMLELLARHGERLVLRVSIDHYSKTLHEVERGPGSWDPMLEGMIWLARNGFNINAAGRTFWKESEAQLRAGYTKLFKRIEIPIDAQNPAEMVLFPEMDATLDVAEISVDCWSTLDVDPASMMCATSRMIVKRKGEDRPVVTPCTLLPYEPSFELGHTLAESAQTVKLNHPHCARFCVLGGGSCSV